MARRARLQFRLVALGVASAALTTAIVSIPPASAHTTKAARVKVQIASAQRQLRQLNSRAEAASERYDAARIQLATAQQTAGAAQRQLATAEHKVAKLQASVTEFAIAAYRGQAATSMLTLTNGSAGRLIGRVSSLQAVSASQSETLISVDAAKRVEEQAQANAKAALANQTADTAAMAADRRQIVTAAANEQTILGHLQAKEAAIIKAAKAAKAKAARLAAERRVAARLAREKAAAAAAARAVVAQPVSPPAPKPAPHVSSAGGGAATAVAWAYKEIGKPYVWGAAGPNAFDCSGLAMYVWAKAGVSLEHFTGDQWNEGTHVSQSQLQPGDLVFFAYNTSEPSTIHHVGIYIGGGEMIDAPFTGAFVRKDPAFRPDYIGAVDPG